jgi:hypothetical protein
MMNYSQKNRSLFCHLITDLHATNHRRLARFDLWGVLGSGFMAAVMVELVRLLVSR